MTRTPPSRVTFTILTPSEPSFPGVASGISGSMIFFSSVFVGVFPSLPGFPSFHGIGSGTRGAMIF